MSNGNSIKHALNGGEKELTIGDKPIRSVDSAKKQIPYTNYMVAVGMDVHIAANPIS